MFFFLILIKTQNKILKSLLIILFVYKYLLSFILCNFQNNSFFFQSCFFLNFFNKKIKFFFLNLNFFLYFNN